MKTKTTQTILPDHHSLKKHIKRANLQAYYLAALFRTKHNKGRPL